MFFATVVTNKDTHETMKAYTEGEAVALILQYTRMLYLSGINDILLLIV